MAHPSLSRLLWLCAGVKINGAFQIWQGDPSIALAGTALAVMAAFKTGCLPAIHAPVSPPLS
ncbi:MAG: hypothetical protein PVJ19_03690 [Desulfobacteraceae bacterium]|jgi:hypothetical protein